ncbi:ketosynthase chain-length factor [Streptomyces sp. ISL-96]|uniref:ketosynthase chain-length factor n=1 Tax=Streptomyces sp. ISL-96 TaxID=2819191 RepID=UPI001BE99151|nr:ketosynthase chain-length factor [Streptomyces sp. ISL-96]MBT2493476.1 ketosynthase chain-length factor [Streptomyces sp. ISL-96]
MSALGIPEGRRRPAVVTGLGVVAPTGIGVRQHWESVLAGKSGLGRITRFDPSPYPVSVAGEVPGFETGEQVPRGLIDRTDRFTHFALAAAEAALTDADVDPKQVPEYEMAVVTASSSGGTEFGQHEMEQLYQKGPAWVGAYQSIAWFYAATTGQVAIRHGMRGPCGVVCAEQAGGLDALGQSRRLLDTGSRLVLSGGTDASLCPYGLTAQLATGALSTADDPTRAYLPFDEAADGYAPGEGGAILLVETQESARERGVHHYGRILGYAAGFDPLPSTGRPPVLASVIRRALADAGVTAQGVDVVFADAAGVPDLDRAEAAAINEVFGVGQVPVTAPKTLTGRLYAGGAALDVATALLSLSAGVIPHTTGTDRPAPGLGIDLVVGRPRHTAARTAVVLARGHGGFTSALVVDAGDRTDHTK